MANWTDWQPDIVITDLGGGDVELAWTAPPGGDLATLDGSPGYFIQLTQDPFVSYDSFIGAGGSPPDPTCATIFIPSSGNTDCADLSAVFHDVPYGDAFTFYLEADGDGATFTFGNPDGGGWSSGTISLGTINMGDSRTVSGATGGGGGGGTPPANDDFANARTILGRSGSDALDTDVTDATVESGEPAGSALSNGIHQSVWFEWTAASSDDVTITTFGSTAAPFGGAPDTTLAVWTGASLGALVEIASAEDSGPPYPDPDAFNASVTFTPVNGTTYKIQAGTNAPGSEGSIMLNWDQPLAPAGPNPYLQARLPTV